MKKNTLIQALQKLQSKDTQVPQKTSTTSLEETLSSYKDLLEVGASLEESYTKLQEKMVLQEQK